MGEADGGPDDARVSAAAGFLADAAGRAEKP